MTGSQDRRQVHLFRKLVVSEFFSCQNSARETSSNPIAVSRIFVLSRYVSSLIVEGGKGNLNRVNIFLLLCIKVDFVRVNLCLVAELCIDL